MPLRCRAGRCIVNRGMIEAAKTEGEVAGVMAHEMSHVALRHGTAQASKATKYAIGSIVGQILGAVIGGTAGQVVSHGTQFGLGTAFSRFSREYEKQADILGSHIMAERRLRPARHGEHVQDDREDLRQRRAAVDERPPEPSNRYQYINQEAAMLKVVNPVRDTRSFLDIQNRLRRMSPAPTTEQASKQGNRRSSQGRYPGGARLAESIRRRRSSERTTKGICSVSPYRQTGRSCRAIPR